MIDVGVIGVGNMGQNHARILSNHKLVNSVYLYDKNSTRVNQVASNFDCLVSSDLESLFSCVSAVVVATPTKTHFEIAKEAIERGIHCLIEKPICTTIEESQQLCDMESSNIVTGVGHIERFNPVVGVIKASIKNPRYMSFIRHNPGSDRIHDTNVVEDLMIHDIDLANALSNVNWTESVISACGNDNTFVSVIYSGYPIVLSASRAATKKTRQIYIEDEEYTVIGDLSDQSVNVYYKPEKYTMMTQESFVGRVNLQRIEPLQNELTTFLDSILSKREFTVPLVHGHINLKLCNVILSCNVKNNENVRKVNV